MISIEAAIVAINARVEASKFSLQSGTRNDICKRIYNFLCAIKGACGEEEKSVLLPGIFPPPFDSDIVGIKGHHKFESPEVKKFFLDKNIGETLDDLTAVSHAIFQMHAAAGMELFPHCTGATEYLTSLFGELVAGLLSVCTVASSMCTQKLILGTASASFYFFLHPEAFKEKDKLGNAPGIAEAWLQHWQKQFDEDAEDFTVSHFTVADIVADTELAPIFKWHAKEAITNHFEEDGRMALFLLVFCATLDFGDDSTPSAGSNYIKFIASVMQTNAAAFKNLGQLLGAGMHASTVRQFAVLKVL